MASIPQFAILLAVALCIISISEARPCKTFFISSYSFSVLRHQNPNSPHLLRPSGFVTVFSEFSQPDRSPFASSKIRVKPRWFPSSDGGDEVESEIVDERRPFRLRPNEPPFGAGFQPEFSYDFTSLRDRTKDIMSVVVALLFGVGCGALTAATMYLAYSLFSTRFQNRSSLYEGYGDGDEDDGKYRADDSDLKKMGYVKIPAESTPATVKAVTHNYSIDADSSTIARDSGFQNSLYGCVQDASEQVDPTTPTRTFVKVYKSASVGCSLDISRVNSYHELRAELAQMFGIEGKLEDLLRSGWLLVYVDRENDVLCLEDDPWEEFVNNVWYIKILSPEDVQKIKMGEH